jgi:spermidine synthase
MSAGCVVQRALPLLVPLLFLGGGCSALVYEIVWFQLLELVIGSSAASLGVLLGTFMGGMCLGSLTVSRLVPARRDPFRVYACLELGIGLLGLAALWIVPASAGLYVAWVGRGLQAQALRAAISAVCLLPATFLMGASLPVIARWTETTPRGVSRLGVLYAVNIAGGVAGCVLAGFYLLRLFDLTVATCVAASINFAAAAIAFALSGRLPSPGAGPEPELATLPEGSRSIHVAIALSGLCALGAEVVWTRLLSVMLGGTTYTFSLILALFLLGLGLGGGLGSWVARSGARPRFALGSCQLLAACAVWWSAYRLAVSLPLGPAQPAGFRPRLWFDLLRVAWTVLPAACLWGASFPLALAAAGSRRHDPARLVGGIYAANTIGAIAGAIGFSVALIPRIGTLSCERLMIAVSAFTAVLALRSPAGGKPWTAAARNGMVTASGAAAMLLACTVQPVPWQAVAYGREATFASDEAELLFLGEGTNASVAVSRIQKVRFFHVSGRVEASSLPQDMRMQRMLGHLPALLHAGPEKVLVVGFGAGVTAGSFVPHPSVERIVVCEIEPLIPVAVAPYFRRENHDVVHDRRTELVFDDARHYVLTTPERFDVITSDPIHPWIKGTAALYSKEYYELCKRRLESGGVIAQWVPLYESDLATVKSEIATFFDVFPDGSIWANDVDQEGYDVVLIGGPGASPIDVDALAARLERADHAAVVQSLREVDLGSAIKLLGTYAGRAHDLAGWLGSAPVNLDRSLRLQYLAGLGLYAKASGSIHDGLLLQRSFPEDLFIGSSERRAALRKALGLP